MQKIIIKDLNLWYEKFQALLHINGAFEERAITAIIGPSGCGKSTLLRVLNRMNDLVEGVRTTGEVWLAGSTPKLGTPDSELINILDPETDLVTLRKKVGMVFQRPNPFPLSIYNNVVFSEKVHGNSDRDYCDNLVEQSLKAVMLWNELKDKLKHSALSLSLEQKQRLCIARLIAAKSEVVLMDEPCSTLDPQATTRIEELMRELKKSYTIVIVTHNMQQAARVSDYTAFMLLGEQIEYNETDKIFTRPQDKRTEDYITGRYG